MRVKLKRGTSLALSTYIGPAGEIVINLDTGLPHVQDGITPGGHSISGVRYTVVQPEIIAPTYNSGGVSRSPIIQSTAFTGAGEHIASYWEISNSFSMKNLAYESNKDNVSLIMDNLADKGIILEPQRTYYVRVRHESDLGFVSDWSAAVKFITAA